MKLKVWIENRIDQEQEWDIKQLVAEFKQSWRSTHLAKDTAFIHWLASEKKATWDLDEQKEGNAVWDAIYDELYGG